MNTPAINRIGEATHPQPLPGGELAGGRPSNSPVLGRGRVGCGRTIRAFTLIELLVVIAVIAILAALLFPVGGKIMQGAMKKRAQAELVQVVAAIESYKAKLGHYPPDNARNIGATIQVNPTVNALYYELVGCVRMNATTYRPLDNSSAAVATNALGVTGIANASASTASDDDVVAAQRFLKEITPTMYGTDGVGVRRLGVAIDGPSAAMIGNISPFRYNSSNPTNNPNSYDLWVDIIVGGKTNRISNWSDKPQQL